MKGGGRCRQLVARRCGEAVDQVTPEEKKRRKQITTKRTKKKNIYPETPAPAPAPAKRE